MISLLMLTFALILAFALILSGWRKHVASTLEIQVINRETIEELERCTGERRWREAYENWEFVRSLKKRIGNSFRLFLHL